MFEMQVLTDHDIDAFVAGQADHQQANDVMDYLLANPGEAERVGQMIKAYRRGSTIESARAAVRKNRPGLFNAV